jgi:glucan phosphoethanolaminetransferase (alkaline phosphatase superfamily)
LRRGETFRSALALSVLALPPAVFLLLDLLWRAERLTSFELVDFGNYGLSLAWSLVCWGALYYSALSNSRWLSAVSSVVFCFFLTASLGSQAYFFQQYHAYISRDVARYATNFSESVLHQVGADLGNFLSFNIPALLVALALLHGGRRAASIKRRRRLWLEVGALGVFFLSLLAPVQHEKRQASTPDMLYMDATGVLLSNVFGLNPDSGMDRPRARASDQLPPLKRQRSAQTNVVFVILESVRQDAVCNSFDPKCRRTPYTNRLFPERIPLSQMRSLTSSTAISMAVLWSGLAPTESRDRLHTAPLLFDYAKRAGYETGYFTSQSILFGNMRLWLKNLGVDRMFTGTDVDPECDIDLGVSEELFVERAITEFASLEEPFFLTIQLSNGHYPYLVRKDGAQPFQPSTTSKAPQSNEKFFNHYQNAIHQQDEYLAQLLGKIASSEAGERTVIVYTSDHGEAFREHHQMGHTFSIFDEEVLVPAWVHAPPGALSAEEENSLREKTDAFTFHPDLTATIVDLLGVYNDPGIARFKERMVGSSLISEKANGRTLPMTNCSPLWSCAFENWGVMHGKMKLEARAWDSQYHCWDLALDPTESANKGDAVCSELVERAGAIYGRLPGMKPTR